MNEHRWQILARQHLAIVTIGWAVTGVIPEPGEAPYAYTIGLTELGAFQNASVTHVLSILDPGYPEERLRYMAQDSAPVAVLTRMLLPSNRTVQDTVV